MPCRRWAVQREGLRSSAGIESKSQTLPPFCFAHIVLSAPGEPIASTELELDHDGHPDARFILPQVRSPKAAVRSSTRTAGRLRGTEVGAVWVGGIGRVYRPPNPGRTSVIASIELGRSVVAAWGSNSTSTRKIRHFRVAIAELPEESNVLSGHVIESDGIVPGFVREARIRREVWRSGDRGRSIDRWKQRQIASRIVQYTTTKSHSVQILLEPEAVVDRKSTRLNSSH